MRRVRMGSVSLVRALACVALVGACAVPEEAVLESDHGLEELLEHRRRMETWEGQSPDEVLALLRVRLPEVQERIAVMRAAFEAIPASSDEATGVRRALAHWVEIDQLARSELMLPLAGLRGAPIEGEDAAFLMGLVGSLNGIDGTHRTALGELLERHGWPVRTRFGAQADHDAWLIVQHADADLGFQEEILELLEPLVEQAESDPSNYAYLFDRVAVAGKRPQRYGTQGECKGFGVWEPFPIEDPDGVDKRRMEVGLSALADYRDIAGTLCP
jgi:hypothetical protein